MFYVNIDMTVNTKTKKINDGRRLHWEKLMCVGITIVYTRAKKSQNKTLLWLEKEDFI